MKLFSSIFMLCFFSAAMSASWENINEAAMHGSAEDIEAYMENGISIESKDEDGFTPLLSAVLTNNIEAVKYLIENGADVDAQDNDKGTALMGACISGKKELAKLLIDNGADEDIKNIDGTSSKEICEMLSPEIFELIENQP